MTSTADTQGGLVQTWLMPGIRGLYPGYFALVMATGIVSNAFFALDYKALAAALLIVNLVAYPVLLAMTLVRIIRFPAAIWHDLKDPRVVFGFFTLVAASDVFGLQLFFHGHRSVAVVLWLFALTLWIVLSYLSFLVLTFAGGDIAVDVVHGGWLIMIVGTESLVLLGNMLAPEFGSLSQTAFLAVHALWGIGIVLYGIFVTLFSFRIFFSRVEPKDMYPLFWVVMGAAAIAANAGSALIVSQPGLAFLDAMKPFVEGTTLTLWAWATWLIPLFVGFGIWRHLVKKFPFTYTPMFWSLVFPLGMYSVATFRLSNAAEFPPILNFSQVMIWVAFAAWSITMLGMLAHIWKGFATARRW